jgi:hypothetical protein
MPSSTSSVANLISPGAVAWTAQAMWLLGLWGYWVDGQRAARSEAPPADGRQAP